jgi:hypothetical protein
MDKQIEGEVRMLLFKNKEKNFKNYFLVFFYPSDHLFCA